MDKADFKKTLKVYRAKKDEPELVDVPEMQYLMIDGKGSPGGPEYVAAIQLLYPVAYTLKFMSKAQSFDYVVPPLETLWWAEDMTAFADGDKDKWIWTAMIMQPKQITRAMFAQACEQVAQKKKVDTSKLRLANLHEGRAVQLLHIGSYASETENIAKLHTFIEEQGGQLDGKVHKHHEIYLSAPRSGDESKLKTIIRQPF